MLFCREALATVQYWPFHAAAVSGRKSLPSSPQLISVGLPVHRPSLLTMHPRIVAIGGLFLLGMD
jgi:hypothetical protein